MEQLATVELFAGIGGFRIAADELGMRTVWANDKCARACSVYRSRFGSNELREGDIRALIQEIPRHDFLTGGFPCQPFSSAGKKRGIGDPRGSLFQAIIDVLRTHSPSFFVLENVKRLLQMESGAHFATILDSLSELGYTIEWRLINGMDLGLPQNRERVLITGTRNQSDQTNVPIPIRLADALEFSGVPECVLEGIHEERRWKEIAYHGRAFPSWGLARTGAFVGCDLNRFADVRPPMSLRDTLQPEVEDQFDFTEATLKWVHENTPVNRYVHGVEILSNQRGGARMGYTIFGVGGVAPTLTSTTSRHYERYKIGDRYRRLTNIEYARIQGFPDNHCDAVPVYDQYSLYGNAVPPVMAKWAMRRLIDGDAVILPEPMTLFAGSK